MSHSVPPKTSISLISRPSTVYQAASIATGRTHQPSRSRSRRLARSIPLQIPPLSRPDLPLPGLPQQRLLTSHGPHRRPQTTLLRRQLRYLRPHKGRTRNKPDKSILQTTRRNRAYQEIHRQCRYLCNPPPLCQREFFLMI